MVGNMKQLLVSDMATEMYVPYCQANEVLPVRSMSVVMSTEPDPRENRDLAAGPAYTAPEAVA